MTKEQIEISPSLVEQLGEEPKKYWRAGLCLVDLPRWNGAMGIHVSERAAWIDREKSLATRHYIAVASAPFEATKEEVDAFAKAEWATLVNVYDESGTVVDSWSVQ